MTSLKVHLRPLDLSLRVFGLSHFAQTSRVEPVTENIPKEKQSTTRQITPKVLRIYCIFICCVLILNVLRYIPSFWVGYDFVPNLTALRIVILLWYTQNAITAIVLFVFFDKKEHFDWCTEQYNRIINDHISKHLKINPECNKTKRCMIRNILIGWVAIIFNTVSIAALIFSDISPDIVVILGNPLPYDSVIVKLLGCLIQFFLSGVWVLSVVLHYSLTSALQLRFEELYRVMENTALEQCEDRFKTLKNIRQKHLQLCKTVETVDQGLSFYIGNIFTVNIGIACFGTYVLINDVDFATEAPEATAFLFWVFSSFFLLFIISTSSATLQEKVGLKHRPSILYLSFVLFLSQMCA